MMFYIHCLFTWRRPRHLVWYQAAGPSVFSSAGGGAAGCSMAASCGSGAFSSRSSSFLKSGKNRSMRFQDSDQSFSLEGSLLGGTRYPLLDMKSNTFFKFSGTASSYSRSASVWCHFGNEPILALLGLELTKLSPCPLFMRRSIMSMILSHRSNIPSHSDRSTKYWRNTLQRSDAAWTLVSLIPSRSDEYTSGFSNFKISGNKTSPNIAVHSR